MGVNLVQQCVRNFYSETCPKSGDKKCPKINRLKFFVSILGNKREGENDLGHISEQVSDMDLGSDVARVFHKGRAIREVWSSLSQQGSKEEAMNILALF